MKDDQTPATKADIQRLYDANQRWKEEILTAMEDWKRQILLDFKLVIEQLRRDFLGARKDKVEILDDRTKHLDRRVSRLEDRVGV